MGKDFQSRVLLEGHALPLVDIRLYQGHFDKKPRVDNPRKMLVIPQLSVEDNGTIKFDVNLWPAPVNEEVRVVNHQIGKIQLNQDYQ